MKANEKLPNGEYLLTNGSVSFKVSRESHHQLIVKATPIVYQYSGLKTDTSQINIKTIFILFIYFYFYLGEFGPMQMWWHFSRPEEFC